MGRECVDHDLQIVVHLLTVRTLVPVYDARGLCTNEVGIEILQLCKKSGLEWLENVDIEARSFVGVVHCAKWIPSAKHTGKERVQLSIAEVYLLADPELDEWAAGGSGSSTK